VSRPHPAAVEAVAKALPERERVEADLAVEPAVGVSEEARRRRHRRVPQLLRKRRRNVPGALAPRGSVFAAVQQEELEVVPEAAMHSLDNAGVEEQPGRKRVRQDEPGLHRVKSKSHCSGGTPVSSIGGSMRAGKRSFTV
jgi:hypothetical protein